MIILPDVRSAARDHDEPLPEDPSEEDEEEEEEIGMMIENRCFPPTYIIISGKDTGEKRTKTKTTIEHQRFSFAERLYSC